MRAFKLALIVISTAISTNLFASVIFFNDSDQDRLVISYAMENSEDPQSWLPVSSTPSIPPKTAFIDKDIVIPNGYTLHVQAVLSIKPDHTTFNTQFVNTIPNANWECSAYNYQNDKNQTTGIIFYTFDKQNIAACTKSTGIN